MDSLKEHRESDAIRTSRSHTYSTQIQTPPKDEVTVTSHSSRLHPKNKDININTAVHYIKPDSDDLIVKYVEDMGR